MSVEQLEQSVLRLSPEERRQFLDWMYAHENELVGAADADHEQAWKEETRRRVAEIEAGRVNGVPGSKVSEKIRRIVGR